MMLRMVVLLLLFESSAFATGLIPLRAGPLSMIFDADNVMLRFVKIGDTEVLRAINAPVRNQYWGTVPPVASQIQLRDEGDSFVLTFNVNCRERDVDFFWKGSILGNSKGQLIFTFDGQAQTTFMKNRIGFCILHGPSAAGKNWVIEDIDGIKTPGKFPLFISPHQPAKNIRGISHEIGPDVWATIRCEGDTFEMEDQRNWTDASFKTYCTPLEIPYPVRINKGTRIQHRIEIEIDGDVSQLLTTNTTSEKHVTLSIVNGTDSLHALPRIGLQTSSQIKSLNSMELQRLKALHLDHLRVTIDPESETLTEDLREASVQAKALGVSLKAAVRLGEKSDKELKHLAKTVETVHPPISDWTILATDLKTFCLARTILSSVTSNAGFGVGEDTNFTELNRNRLTDPHIDLVSFGLNPQCHAIDKLTMIETLEIQGDAARSAQQFINDCPLWVSPITLKVQNVQQAPLVGELPSNVDSRQPSLFAAGWTLGSIKYLAESDVKGMTYFETVGWKGVMAPGTDFGLPPIFPATPNAVFAMYHVLKNVGQFAGGQVREVHSTDTLSAVGMAITKNDRNRLMLANLANQPQQITIRGIASENAELFLLDDTNSASANGDPERFASRSGQPLTIDQQTVTLRIAPYGIARIDY